MAGSDLYGQNRRHRSRSDRRRDTILGNRHETRIVHLCMSCLLLRLFVWSDPYSLCLTSTTSQQAIVVTTELESEARCPDKSPYSFQTRYNQSSWYTSLEWACTSSASRDFVAGVECHRYKCLYCYIVRREALPINTNRSNLVRLAVGRARVPIPFGRERHNCILEAIVPADRFAFGARCRPPHPARQRSSL